jgi:3-hydroxyacyl-[acyl-carrier-protein] dehydratase
MTVDSDSRGKTDQRMWHELEDVREGPGGEIEARMIIGPDSHWFSGHFPEEPVLPGIAQLGVVLEALIRVAGRSLTVTGIRRVRFRQAIKPCDRVDISIKPAGETDYAFRLAVLEEPVCSGVMQVAETEAGNR